MTRPQMINNIRDRLLEEYDLDIPRKTIDAIIKIEEDEIYQVIALNDSFHYQWGRIGGMEKTPIKSRGMYVELDSVRARGGYSNWKIGYPYIRWSKAAKLCENKPPEEYFSLPEHKYTSAAREYRKFLNLPELPEFEGLSEEKIEKICKKADQIEKDKKYSPGKQRKLERDARYNKVNTDALHDRWKETGYKPMGAIEWDGPRNDTIGYMIERYINHEDDIIHKLDMILHVRDVAEYKGQIAAHYEELKNLEEETRAEIERQGLTPKEHKNLTNGATGFNLRLKGEKDPWGLDNVVRRTKKEIAERNRKVTEEFYKELELEQSLLNKEENQVDDSSNETKDSENE